tara:strand:+ start:13 stop:423 length:411 start_codon:yes stop_codon:yes gene_type:complete
MKSEKDKEIYNILCNIFDNTDVSKIILDKKNNIEKIETLNYHINRWNNISGHFYKVRDTNYNKYSYIFHKPTGIEYIIKKDHILDFYKNTGLSYQCIELIHELIKISDDKKWLKEDDKKYSILSTKIMNEMNKRRM